MPLYRDEGIVLRTQKLGEADRIVTLLTRGLGKVRVVGKGVRRTKSRFGARLEPGMMVDLQCYEGRTLDTVTQAESLASWGEVLARDYTTYTAASAMLETADRLTEEREPNLQQYLLLAGALRSMAEGLHDPGLVLDASSCARSPSPAGRPASTTAPAVGLRVRTGRSTWPRAARSARYAAHRAQRRRHRKPWPSSRRCSRGTGTWLTPHSRGTAGRAAAWPAPSSNGTWSAVCDRCASWTDATLRAQQHRRTLTHR